MASGGPSEDELLEQIEKEMKEKPPKKTTEGIRDWMLQYLKKTGGIKEEMVQPKDPVQKSDKGYIHVSKRDPPKISCFSGGNAKNETTYDLWKYEVTSLMNNTAYDNESINYAVRRSLKGEAGRVAMHLGPQASLPEILHKLDSIYGAVESKEELLADFYRAKQKEDESVTTWSCRLEDILGKAVDKGLVHHKDRDGMLRSMLWTGLRTQLKDITGHKYDAMSTFDELRIALRQIEKDHEERKETKKPHIMKSAVTDQDESKSDMNELKGLIHQLSTRMDRWDNRGGYRQNNDDYRQQPQRQQRWQNQQRQQPPRQHRWQDQQYQQPSAPTQRWQEPQQRPARPQRMNNRPQQQPASTSVHTDSPQKIVCYRCGQEGHKKIGCANPSNKYRTDLNSKKPMEQGHQ